MKKAITIKNALITDKEYLDNLATTSSITVAEALSKLITIAKTAKSPEQIEEIRKENEGELANLNQTIVEQSKELISLRIELEEAKNKPAETIEKTIEKTIEVIKPIELNGFQFICELDERNSRNARKVRSFVKKEGYYEALPDETPAQYINALTNLAIPYFLRKNFPDHID